jgi:hypothetical protein
LFAVFSFAVVFFNLDLFQAISNLYHLFVSYPLLSALAISAISLFFLSVGLVRLSIRKKERQQKKEIESREKYVQIKLPFFKANEEKLEKLRMDMWNAYDANAQNHTSHLLTIVVALVAFIAGLQTLSENLVLGSTLLLMFGGLALISGWLMLRNQYWCTLSSQILALTGEDLILLFNRWNKENRHYQNNMPPCCAVLTYALRQKIIELQNDYNWIHNPFKKLSFRTTGIRIEKTENPTS